MMGCIFMEALCRKYEVDMYGESKITDLAIFQALTGHRLLTRSPLRRAWAVNGVSTLGKDYKLKCHRCDLSPDMCVVAQDLMYNLNFLVWTLDFQVVFFFWNALSEELTG